MYTLILAHLVTAVYMTGVVWFVQIVHYPLIARVPPDGSSVYAREHTRRTGRVVIVPMLVELATALMLLVVPSPLVSRPLAMGGAALLGVIWISTFALQVPAHRRLADGFDASVHRRLVTTNWIRTAAWSLRAALACMIVERAR